MSQFEQHTPEENDAERHFWRASFDEAADIPPSRVWDAIERRLDEEEQGIIPLWGSSPAVGAGVGSTAGGLAQGGVQTIRPWVRWSAAAAAIALLSIGWWALQPNSTDIASSSVADRSARKVQAPVNPDQPSVLSANTEASESIADSKTPTETDVPAPSEKLVSEHGQTRTEKIADRTVMPQYASGRKKTGDKKGVRNTTGNRPISEETESLVAVTTARQKVNVTTGSAVANPLTETPGAVSEASPPTIGVSIAKTALPDMPEEEKAVISFTEIETLKAPSILAKLHETQRIVWFRAEQTEPTEVESTKPVSRREVWASASIMPGSYNPAVTLQAAPAGIAFANYVPTTRNTLGNELVNSQANLSMTYQLTTGMQLGSRWSVETGVGYLEARSTVNSPTHTVLASMAPSSAVGGKTSNLYADALSGSKGSLSMASQDKNSQSYIANTNLYDAAQTQVVNNEYQFVQVPVQVGYQLRPRKRFGLALLGGLLTNWFVRNKVADELTITAQDGVYRSVTLAATTGLRLRYHPTPRWSASMAGMYQHSLQNGTASAASVQTRPKTVGVSMGVDYHF